MDFAEQAFDDTIVRRGGRRNAVVMVTLIRVQRGRGPAGRQPHRENRTGY